MKTLFSALLLTTCFSISYSQTKEEKAKIIAGTNVSELNRLAPIYDSIFKTEKEKAWKLAKIKGWKTIFSSKKNGGITELMSVNKEGNPVYYTTDNAGAAQTTRANRLNAGGSLGLNLDGQDMTIGIWDGGGVRSTHNLLTGRVDQVDNPPSLSSHATHVAGTMMGNATASPQSKGMASQANLRAYDWNSDVNEVTLAAANGLLVSNHSYGADPDFVSIADWGRYDGEAKFFDNVMFNAPYYQFVNSAGNSRNAGYNDEKQGYDLLSGKSTSKNGIIVAAVSQVTNYTGPSSVSMSGFSSWGPTDDGRIKPDICGKGVNVRSSTANSNSSYSSYSGTSMSSPNVAGTLLLLQQHFKNVKGGFMRAATLRGLAIHTADEAGTAPGPDYRFGWGLLNAEKAAVLITNEGTQSYIQENILGQGKSYSFDINAISTTQPIVATICWTDPAGIVQQSNQIDLSTPALVNDLDIRITKGNSVNFPWKLNPIEVDEPATREDNKVDNVEKIEIANPVGTYTVTVTHKGTLVNNLQHYSLIISGVTADRMLVTSDNSLLNRNCVGANESTFTFQLKTPAVFSETASFEVLGLPAGASATFSPTTLSASGSGSVLISGLSATQVGNYPLTLRATSASYSTSLSLNLVVQNSLTTAPNLTNPSNNANPADTNPTLVWDNIGSNVTNYTVEISKDALFATNVASYTSVTNQIDISDLDYGSDYYWRVKSNNICGSSNYSSVYKFTTQCSDANEITISSLTVSGATVTWSNPNGSSLFEVLVVPQGTTPTGPFETVTTNSYTLTNLNSYSNYDFYVRASCSNNVFSALSNASFSTLINFCVDGVFFDSGGPSGDYSNGENYTTTITPANPGEKASVTFTSFSLENQSDKLRIYDGPNSTYPFIGQQYGFTGTNNPGTITSTDATGALTFAFYSDGINTSPGWTATVNCSVLSVSNFSQDQLSYYPNPAKDKVSFSSPKTIKSIAIYTLLGQLVQEQTTEAKQAMVDISRLATGQYLFKVATDSTVSTVKIIKVN